MDVRLIVSASKDLILTFLISESQLREIKVEDRKAPRLAGSIFKAKVKRMVKSLSGVFLDLGMEKEAFMPVKDYLTNGASGPPKEGDYLLVQMKREPMGEKGAKVSCRVSLPGKYIVYLPSSGQVHVSSKIGSLERREALKKFLEGILENNEGAIVRTSAKEADEEVIKFELLHLREIWKEIVKRAENKNGPGMVYQEVPHYLQLVRDMWKNISEIALDDRELFLETLAFLEDYYPELIGRVRYVKNISVLLKRFNVDQALSRIFSKYVWLKGGGYIVIEETEAMTVIDVNSGQGSGENLEENALKTNLEAAEEIVRQIKLRGIGGIIVVDFIDMKDKKNREKVVNKVKELFADEGSKVHVYGMTNLGLLEISRRKETPSVVKSLSTTCPHCKGRGMVKRPELVLYEIEKELDYFKGRYIEIRVSPALKNKVNEILDKKNLKDWVTVKEVCDVPVDYYEVFLTG